MTTAAIYAFTFVAWVLLLAIVLLSWKIGQALMDDYLRRGVGVADVLMVAAGVLGLTMLVVFGLGCLLVAAYSARVAWEDWTRENWFGTALDIVPALIAGLGGLAVLTLAGAAAYSWIVTG